ncbi:sigma-54-dependent Fis family transcriptional regulator [Pseudonocardia nigra]|uniref:sigma-54-dependent Fis family transcriptional regulator n=1 Tax=Pseudonocardia nigra TaxID=1921578 RepID=UPI001C5D2970|nr:helix-turn-helix domain-containing protein [Pseudonocardia nigra]
MAVGGTDRDGVLARAWHLLDTGGDLPSELPSTIRYSWMRSRLAHVPRDRIDVPFTEAAGAGDRLRLAAEPVLGRFAEQLGGTQVAIVLADREARVIGRWAGETSPLRRLAKASIEEGSVLAEEYAGTNGVGTALETLTPVAIRGAEHYTEPLQRFVCVGVPIRHPLTRRVEGVLNLSCPVGDGNGLLLPTVLDLGRQIEHELTSRSSLHDQVVFEEFLARSRLTSAALVALGGQFMLTNFSAASLLQPSDQALLWQQAAESFSEETTVTRIFRLGTGEETHARCTPVRIANRVVGALIEVDNEAAPRRRRAHLTAVVSPFRSGAWVELERALASFALGPGDRLRLLGEQGSGKATLAERIHHRLVTEAGRPAPDLTVLRCEAPDLDADTWAAVERRLGDPNGTLVVCGIDRLTADAAGRLLELLDGAPDPPLFVTTCARGADADYRVLDHGFGHQVLRVPPLRERRDDLPDLVYETIRLHCHPVRRVTHQAMAALISYHWPGNLRQLVATIAEATAVSGVDLDLPHLPESIRACGLGRRRLTRMEEIEREAITQSLRENSGNKNRTAASLGVDRLRG